MEARSVCPSLLKSPVATTCPPPMGKVAVSGNRGGVCAKAGRDRVTGHRTTTSGRIPLSGSLKHEQAGILKSVSSGGKLERVERRVFVDVTGATTVAIVSRRPEGVSIGAMILRWKCCAGICLKNGFRRGG